MVKEDFGIFINNYFEKSYERTREGLKKLDNSLKELKGKICTEFQVPMNSVSVTTKFFTTQGINYCFIFASMYCDKLYTETLCVEVTD